MMLVILGQESRHRVKMNEAMETRSARSRSVMIRPDLSTRWKAPRLWRLWPQVLGSAGQGGGGTIAGQREHRGDQNGANDDQDSPPVGSRDIMT